VGGRLDPFWDAEQSVEDEQAGRKDTEGHKTKA
jgi:hypothetical protein